MSPPAVIVVGNVVDLRETLSWFETKPLFGWRAWCPAPRSRPARSRGCAATAPCPRRSRPSRSSRRATCSRWTRPCAAWSRAATSGSRSPRSTRSAVREKFEEYGLDARAFSGSRSPRSATRPPRPSPPGACAPTWCPSGAVRRRPAGGLAGVRRGARPDQPGLPAARRHRHRDLVAGLIDLGWECDDVTAYRTVRATPRRRPPGTRSRAASSTRSCSRRPRPCATWSASPASRTRRRSSP